jgi:hypothetical protein
MAVQAFAGLNRFYVSTVPRSSGDLKICKNLTSKKIKEEYFFKNLTFG